jgi:hypothetical protein
VCRLSRTTIDIFPKSTQASGLGDVQFRRCRSPAEGRIGSCSDGRVEWGRNPQHDSSQPFYLHVPGLTLVTHATGCVPLASVPSVWNLLFLPKELRIKHIIHMSFGIILKYYSQDLSP